MKKSYYILARITGLLILLLLAAFAAIQHPRVQQLISRRIVTALSASLDADIRYGEFQLLPFNGILLKDLVILDRHPYREDRYGRGWAPADTFASARLISATFKLGGLLRKEGLHLGHVFVGRGFLHLVIEPTEAGTNLVRILGDTSDSPAQNMGNIFDVQNLQIEDFRFRMTNFNEGGFGWEGYGLNYEDLDVTASLRGHGLRFAGGRMSGICDDARIKDKSGCSIRHLGGSAAVGLGKAEIRNLHFVDSLSDLRLRHYTMTYRDGSAFGRYIHDVRMDAEIEGGTLALKSIAGFSNGVFRDNDCIAVLGGGCFHGHVDHFTLSGVDVTEKNSGIHGTVDGTLTGLPHLGQSCVDATLRDGRFTTRGLDMLVRAWNGGRSALRLSQLAPGETFTLEAKAKGPANRMAVQTAIRSRIGSFSSADEIRNLFDPQRALEINGTARSDAMALDKLLQTETLGALDARLAFRALLETESPSVIIDSLLVERLQCLGYAYRDLRLSGRWAENRIEGGLQSRDPNMDFTLQADVAYDSLGRFPGHIDADFRHCDLQATGLSAGRAETAFRLSADLKADFADSRPADVRISDWYFTNGTGRHHFGDLLLRSRTQDQVEHISVQSRFFDAQYKGGPSVLGFPADLLATTLHRHLPALFPKGKTARFSHTPYELEILFSDCREVCSCLQNGFYIGEKTRLGLTLDEDGTLSGRLASPRLAWNGHYLKQLSLDVDNLDNSLNLNLVSEEAQIAGLQGKDASLRCIGKDNEVFLSLLYDGMDKEKNAGEIFVNGTLQRDENDSLLVRAHPLPSFIRLEGDNWELAESDITWQGGKVSLRDFALSSGKQRISADGGFSTREQDTLHVQVTQLDLDLLNKLGGEWGVGGRIDGHASLASPVSGHFGLLAECRADSLTIDGEPIGDIRLGSQWNEAEKRMDFHVDNTLNGKQVLLADGHYRFPDKALSVSARADSLRLQLLHPVFGHSLSETGGFLSGSATLQGKEGRYDVASGLMRLDDALVRIHYTNVAYIANGTFHLTGDGLYLDDMHVRDAYGGTGRLRGAVRYKGLQDFSLDIGAEVSGLRAIDLPAAMRHDIDGELDVTGTASVTGPPDALSVDADLHTDRGRVNVPLRSSASASSGNLLTFTTEEEDPYVTLSAIRSDPPKRSGLTTRARLEITPEVTASIQMGGSSDHALSASGSGTVEVDYRPGADILLLNGSYNIREGRYHFELPGVTSRQFDIRDGSAVHFNGQFQDMSFDVNAVYNVKASLANLLADSTGVAIRRNVECRLALTGTLDKLQTGFDVYVPDLDPGTKADVEAALNTEDKKQKQFVSLLVFGTFLPSEQSGIVNSSGMLYSNVTEIVSNQMNNILHKLDIPLDFGFGYQKDRSGLDMFDLAVSTQLFNNRVVVNGSVGNRSGAGTGSDIVGDLDIDLKIDRGGLFRVNLFSHSADKYTRNLDASQRNGIGMTYQAEYDRLGDIFLPRKKREAQKAEREKETKTIRIP